MTDALDNALQNAPHNGPDIAPGSDPSHANPALDPAQHGVVGWASVAVAHDAFARTVVFLLAEHALGRIPDAGDTQQLLPLVTRFKAVHAFVAEQAIRDIVNTDAFGRP